MNRFMGGFAAATILLIAATAAGRMWLPAGFAAAAAVPALWLAVRASRRRDRDPVQPDPYAAPAVFAARGDAPAPPARR